MCAYTRAMACVWSGETLRQSVLLHVSPGDRTQVTGFGAHPVTYRAFSSFKTLRRGSVTVKFTVQRARDVNTP